VAPRPCGTQLGSARPGGRNRLVDAVAGSARQILRRLDERLRPDRTGRPDADDEIVINLNPHLVPAWVTRLWSSGARVAFWCPDSMTNLGRLMLLPSYDAIFFKEPRLADRLRATLGPPVRYLQFSLVPASKPGRHPSPAW